MDCIVDIRSDEDPYKHKIKKWKIKEKIIIKKKNKKKKKDKNEEMKNIEIFK